DSLGNVMWARNAGASDWIPGNFSVDLDAAGNIYLTGTFADSAFLEKYDAAGNQLLKKYYSGNTFVNNAHPWSISTDAAGNNFITGYFSNPSLVFGTTTLTNANGGYQIFIVKTDSSGNIIWAKNDGVYPSLYKPYISSDGAGNCYITGYFNGTSCMFGSTILLNAGANDIFVVKYNPSGNVVWAKRAGGTHFDLGMGIRTDANGNSYITGFFRGTAYFDNFTLFSANDPEIFVAKYDSSGNVLWAKSAGGSDVDNSNAIGIDAQGNCYIGGNFFSANAYFDIIVLPNSNLSTFPSEVFVAKLGSGTVTGITPIPALVNTENSIVYPNPANDVLTVSVSEFPCGIVLYDVSGREVLSEQLIKESDQIKIKNLLPGIYFYEVKGYDKVVKKGKIVKE
ncbi:MAG TPA: T9SS type A sorting domain-containing protein, partial [Bacteroidia bacterium]|nr:T9SS type A sorting domain-containing protein [Bacteroidia bacterium]